MGATIEGDLKFAFIGGQRGVQWLHCASFTAQKIALNLTEQGGKRSMRAIIALLAATWTVCGCSPYLYQKEVGSFSSSVIAVSTAVTQGLDNLDQDQAAADLAEVVSKRAGVNLSTGCSSEGPNEPCRLMVIPKTAPDSSAADDFGPFKPQLLKVLAALNGYAGGLAAVTNAQDRKDYDAAASQLSSSVAGLGTALGAVTPGGAAAGPALSAVTMVATWTIGEGLDAARYDTLRSAINAVGTPSIDLEGQKMSPIRVVADNAITPELAAVRSARITLLFKQMDSRANRINSDLSAANAADVPLDRYDTPLMDLASLVATLNAIKAVDPEAVGESLVKAHDELQKAVNDKSRQFQSLVSSLADFADKAAAVEKAFAKKPTTTGGGK
jgi:hypothetical protein